MAKVGTSSQDRTISLKAAVRSCINKKRAPEISNGIISLIIKGQVDEEPFAKRDTGSYVVVTNFGNTFGSA